VLFAKRTTQLGLHGDERLPVRFELRPLRAVSAQTLSFDNEVSNHFAN